LALVGAMGAYLVIGSGGDAETIGAGQVIGTSAGGVRETACSMLDGATSPDAPPSQAEEPDDFPDATVRLLLDGSASMTVPPYTGFDGQGHSSDEDSYENSWGIVCPELNEPAVSQGGGASLWASLREGVATNGVTGAYCCGAKWTRKRALLQFSLSLDGGQEVDLAKIRGFCPNCEPPSTSACLFDGATDAEIQIVDENDVHHQGKWKVMTDTVYLPEGARVGILLDVLNTGSFDFSAADDPRMKANAQFKIGNTSVIASVDEILEHAQDEGIYVAGYTGDHDIELWVDSHIVVDFEQSAVCPVYDAQTFDLQTDIKVVLTGIHSL